MVFSGQAGGFPATVAELLGEGGLGIEYVPITFDVADREPFEIDVVRIRGWHWCDQRIAHAHVDRIEGALIVPSDAIRTTEDGPVVVRASQSTGEAGAPLIPWWP